MRTYSHYTKEAALLFGTLIRVARKERRFTLQEVAERAGISRGLLQRIEKGDLSASIGSVFEVAAIVGIRLFDADDKKLRHEILRNEEMLTLLPKAIHGPKKEVDDDF